MLIGFIILSLTWIVVDQIGAKRMEAYNQWQKKYAELEKNYSQVEEDLRQQRHYANELAAKLGGMKPPPPAHEGAN